MKRGKTVVVGFADQHSSELARRDRPQARRRSASRARLRGPGAARTLLVRHHRAVRAGADAVGRGASPSATRDGARHAAEPVILDEPTNDLDLDTLRSLEAFLDDWPARWWSPATTGRSSTASPITCWRSIRAEASDGYRRGGRDGCGRASAVAARPVPRPRRPRSILHGDTIDGPTRQPTERAEPFDDRAAAPRGRAGDGQGARARRRAHRAARRVDRPCRTLSDRGRAGRRTARARRTRDHLARTGCAPGRLTARNRVVGSAPSRSGRRSRRRCRFGTNRRSPAAACGGMTPATHGDDGGDEHDDPAEQRSSPAVVVEQRPRRPWRGRRAWPPTRVARPSRKLNSTAAAIEAPIARAAAIVTRLRLTPARGRGSARRR